MRYEFKENFQWGVATAAYQIEGACYEDGKGENIWDRFCHIPGNIAGDANADVACDFYHRYKEDIRTVHELGIPCFRFSIGWARIYSDGPDKINEKGIDFYEQVIRELERYEIKPVITLYHWDMPQWLQDIGGWLNRESIRYFAEFCETMIRRFDGRVDKWITINEPWVCAFNGHYWGNFAPGLRDFSAALQAAHHMLCAHGTVVRMFRDKEYQGEIGIVLNLCPKDPASEEETDKEAARIDDGFSNRWFLDPLFKGRYPEDMVHWYAMHEIVIPSIREGDMELISEAVDFLGINYYYVEFVKKCEDRWPLYFDTTTKDYPVTAYGWAIVEEGLTRLLVRLHKEYGEPRLIVTENGASFVDTVDEDGKINDDNRIDYLRRHIKACHRAAEQGVKLEGYYVWTLMDDFEWPTGYQNYFGLIHVDRDTLHRTVKKSGYWYGRVVRENGLTEEDEEISQ